MVKNTLLTFGLISIVLLNGCGDSDSSDEATVGTTYTVTADPVTITNEVEATRAVSAVSGINYGASGANYAPVRPSTSRAISLAAVNETENCFDGGTIVTTGDISETTANFTDTYNNCIEYGETTNGAIQIVGSVSNGISNLTVSYTNLNTEYSSSETNMNGTMKAKLDSSNYNAIDMLMDAQMSISEYTPANEILITYENFYITGDLYTFNMNGKTSVSSTLYPCQDGAYDIETVSALTVDYSGGFTAGTMKVNGATFEFHNNNEVTITYADGTSGGRVSQISSMSCD